jgi:plastocyanin domain-containing protein
MTATEIIVNVSGLAVIAWIVWYFWLWQGGSVTAQTKNGIQTVDVVVKGGYQPAAIMVKAGRRVRLNFTRREASTCGEEIVIPDFGKRAYLPENSSVAIEIMPEKPGEYAFRCGMNMYRGKLIAE